jgi:threonine aldolase
LKHTLIGYVRHRSRREENVVDNVIDLRSDTVTRPTAEMRAAMAAAEVGDDVYGDDPTVNRLQDIAAERLGFEAALFAPSGTQANLIALMAHCQRGDEYIVGQRAHTYLNEGGGAAVLGSIQPQPVAHKADGSLDPVAVEQVIKIDGNIHHARSRLICLENTINGKVVPLANLTAMRAVADRHGLALHLDGARIFNAAVKLGVDVRAISGHFDSVAFCLSKGLGAPVGSLLCGSRALLLHAKRWRKVTGGGLRQAGILAAAGIVALERHVDRLHEDHDNAARLAQGLAQIDGVEVDLDAVQTNMVFAQLTRGTPEALCEHLSRHGVLARPGRPMRLVTHLDVSSADVERALHAFRAYAP